jgi:2-polyprenyl-3-methyl-5-hydroxy-6-metoxy-1,4-benzoquinol methylase
MEDHIKKTKQTYSLIYQDYALRNTVINKYVKAKLDRFITFLAGKDVLDIGCAAGLATNYLYDKGLNATGCDLSEEFIKLAKENYPECSFFVSDMRKIASRDELYDGLWVSASFLHIPKKDAKITLEGFYKILKKSGVMYISVMKGEYDGLRSNPKTNWPERHFSDYSIDEFATLLRETHFSVINYSSKKTSWGPTFLHFIAKK